MNPSIEPLLNSIEAAGADGRGTLPMRVLCTLAAGLFLNFNVNTTVAAIWTLATLSGEAVAFVLTDRRGSTPRRRVIYHGLLVAHGIYQTALWTGLSLLYWRSGQAALQVTAMAILAVQLLHAAIYAYRSPAAFALTGGMAAIGALVLPWIGAFNLMQAVTVAVSAAIVVSYAVNAARYNFLIRNQFRASQRELEQQTAAAMAANEAKSAFLAMMSHELRTPMNGVLGMAHALKTTALSAEQAHYVDLQIRSGDALLAILNDILDLSKVEAGRVDLEAIPFDLYELGGRVCDFWQEVARSKGVALVYAFPQDAAGWVTGDPTRLRQILNNLMSNALKFTEAGEVGLTILSRGEEPDGRRRFTLSVSDTGPGISQAGQAQLFQPFAQADRAVYRRHGGTGLGLAICRHLAQLMGGDITIESVVGAGSTFHVQVSLPIAEPQRTQTADAASGNLEGFRVLVADDNAVNQVVARAILEAAGASVAVADDGCAALDALRREDFDAVLMDVHMPVMDGLEALGRIRAGEAGRPDTPVIALTGDAMIGDCSALLVRGFDAVQPKPIQPAALLAILLEACTTAACPAGAPNVALT